MSRIGKKAIIYTPDILVNKKQDLINIKGPKGQIDLKLPEGIEILVSTNQILINCQSGSNKSNLQGLYRTLIDNAIKGVTDEWSKTLEMVGVGFRAQIEGDELILNLGFSHPVKIKAPKGISFQIHENKIIIKGSDKYMVGEVAASIRRIKKPEPYKGKGIRYLGEYIRKKAGKAAKTVGGIGGK